MKICKPAKETPRGDFECGECGLVWTLQSMAENCCAKELNSANHIQIGGDHYHDKAIQPWDAMEAWMPKEQFIGFLRGNAIKYLARAGSKGPDVIDYRKAQHYMAKLIEVLEND